MLSLAAEFGNYSGRDPTGSLAHTTPRITGSSVCHHLSVRRSAEVDVAEKVLSVADSAETHFTVHDQPTSLQTVIETTYSAPGSPDLSAAFHTYGLFWRDDTLGKQGALEAYIDGKPIVDHPAPINDPSWGGGAYCYAGWMQQELALWGGGVSNNAHSLRRTRSISGASRSGNRSEPAFSIRVPSDLRLRDRSKYS